MALFFTGIAQLDRLLGGGMPDKALLSVVAYPGSGKSTFCRQFAEEGLKHGEPCVYFTTSTSVAELKARLKSVENGTIVFVDGYSWRMGGTRQKEAGVKLLSSLTDINEINRVLSNALRDAGMNEKSGRLIIDSVSDLFLQNEMTSVLKFVQIVSGEIQSGSHVGVIALEEGVHDSKVIASIEYVTTGTLKMKQEAGKRFIQIARMTGVDHPRTWIEFTIEAKGIMMRAEEVF